MPSLSNRPVRRLGSAIAGRGRAVRRVAASAGARRRRRLEQLRLIQDSPLFDAAWYLETYSDVAAAGVDPAVHFLETGWLEGRDPGPDFATSAYLKANADVARQGLNPLLHYIEFGQSEGREVRGHPFTPWKRTGIVHHFERAAPVFRGKPKEGRSAAWRSWYRLAADDPDLFSMGGFAVGYARSAEMRVSLEGRLGQVRRLCGFGDGSGETGREGEPPAQLIDAWYVNDATLRTRWSRKDFPFVVRALQPDPRRNGEMRLVADTVVVSPLDIVDCSLGDPYSPLFFVFAEPDGEILGSRLLCLPSLCRGGLHYPELVALTPEGAAPDPLGLGSALAARLVAARGAKRAVCVDLAGGDGKSPLFQPDFRRWLDRIAGVGVRPLVDDGGSLAELLRDAGPVADAGGGLVLASDMVPTLSALANDAGGKPALAPVLVAQRDPSQPVALVELPDDAPAVVAQGAAGYPAPWATTLAGGSKAPAAIRLAPGEARGEAELLVPASGASLPLNAQGEASISWLVASGDFDLASFVEAAEALVLQSGPITHTIAFIGGPDAAIRSAAMAMFGGRVKAFSDVSAAAASATTDFVGYLGRGVVLHDNRAVAMLLSLLDDADVASASCALVTADKRGKSWHVTVAEAGALAGAADDWTEIDPRQLWRCSYPVVRPPRELWLARTQMVQGWSDDKDATLRHGSHVCTTLVTASYVKQRQKGDGAFRVPAAPAERALSARTVFG